MTDPVPSQVELDLPMPAPLPPPASAGRRAAFAGLTRWQMLGAGLALLLLVWAMWVTKSLLAPHRDQIVSARLSTIVGDYVQAQARSASPPERVEAEMRQFMGALEQELQRRSGNGQIVMVGEAVLSRNVPDITESLKKAVYGSGIAFPRRASAQQMEHLSRGAEPAAPLGQAAMAGGAGTSAQHDPMATGEGQVPDAGGRAGESAALPMGPSDPGAGASVATFGGFDGAGDR
ncbi:MULTISPECIES: TrbI F-type domain-containing protein [Sphingobium]|uniref:Type-F conjugative transfer system protein (TrbI_Ftype) n=1 Tax=Sphingobium chungbukense TaxID=56193 RepID=A0A0M3APU7_9SPHN|nr:MULTISPECIES: TrbI F-type domain-containing protein [Sphingobium]AMK26062.1 hypothetical protein K426_25810 [Sphingobium sp. TKS]KKW90569.1 hypothetical protein YP76_18425 [Sphingobium chungbukense]